MKRIVLLAVATALALGCARRAPLPAASGPTVATGSAVKLRLPLHPDRAPFSLEAARGKVVLLDVWATWCEPCKDSLPLFQEMLKQYGPQGFSVYTVNVDEDERMVQPFLDAAKVTLPVLLDPEATVERTLGVNKVPTTFLFDRRGTLRYVHEGFSDEHLGRTQRQVEELLAEEP